MRYFIILLNILFLLSCHAQDYIKYSVEAGQHDYTPKQLFGGVFNRINTSKIDALEYEAYFDSSSIYTHPLSDDQIDWNKGGGFSFDLLTNHNNSVMWAWRWTPELGGFEISGYAHISGERFMFDLPYLVVAPNEVFFVSIKELESKTWRVSLSDKKGNSIYKEVWFKTQGKKARRIEPWFGGNLASQNDGHFYQKIQIKKH